MVAAFARHIYFYVFILTQVVRDIFIFLESIFDQATINPNFTNDLNLKFTLRLVLCVQ